MQFPDSALAPDRATASQTTPKQTRRAATPLAQVQQIQLVPRWVRSPGPTPEAAAATAFFAGASLALFDQTLRAGADGAEAEYAGCLRQRLALRAGESCAKLSRLREDARDLRDAEHLAGGIETTPAGRLHRVFRLYASQPARFEAALSRTAGLFGLQDAIDAGALAGAVAAAPDPLDAAAQASVAVMKRCAQCPEAAIVAFVAADLALANRLGWTRPVPLLALAIAHPSLRGAGGRRPRPLDDDWPAAVMWSYGRAVVEAQALAVELARRSQKLLAVAPMLRARGARRIIDLLLSDDAITPAAAAVRAKVSDRAARRLFDRLLALDVVRELSGRETFRIYGL